MSEVLEILRALQSNDNQIRDAAEASFKNAKAQNPVMTMSSLLQVLVQQVEEGTKEEAAILLRQCLVKAKESTSIWGSLPLAAQAECKANLLQVFENEPNAKVRRKIGDIIKFLGRQIISLREEERPTNADHWPELLPFVMRIVMDTSRDGQLRADALLALDMGAIWQVMLANSQNTFQVLKACMSDPNLPVQANAVTTFVTLLDQITQKQERQPFYPLIGDFCGVVARLADSPDSTALDNVLQQMEATEASAAFFKDNLTTSLLPLLSQIAQGHKSEESRKLALEALLGFAEARKKSMGKAVEYIDKVLSIALEFILQLSPVQEWAEGDPESLEEDEEGLSIFGREAVDRLGSMMTTAESFPVFLELVKPKLSVLFQDGDWKKTVAGLYLLSQIAEYVDDEPTVSQMLSVIQAQLKATNIRVRATAWVALAQFSKDHPDVATAEALAPQFLQAFKESLDDPCVRVLIYSMQAFQHFGQEVERELLEPFVEPMMEKLMQKLQTAPLSVQRLVVTFIAVLAGQMEDGFARYYQHLMPLLKQVVQTMLHRVEERTLLGRCFECMSLLSKAIGQAGFRADAEEIMRCMVQAASVPNLPREDPVLEYMMHASQRICWTMKEDFLPFIPGVLPLVLDKFTVKPKELTPETRKNFKKDDEVEMVLVPGEDGKVKVMLMSVSEKEEIQNAVECTHTFVEELGKLYAPFVVQTAQALLPVLDFVMGEEIRKMAFDTWGELCKVAKDSGEAGMLAQLAQEFMSRVLAKIDKEEEDPDTDGIKTGLDGLKTCLEKAGAGMLSDQQLQHLVQVTLKLLMGSFRRREEDVKNRQSLPDNDIEEEEDDTEGELPLRISCVELLGGLMQQNPQAFAAQCMPVVLPLVQQLIPSSVPPNDRRLAIFLCCDFFTHFEDQGVAHWPIFMPQLLQDIQNPQVDLRAAACYAVSLAAKSPAFANVAADAAAKLKEVIMVSRGRAKRKSEKPAQAAADNALTGLSMILQHHRASVAAQEATMWSVWLEALPCQEDEEEGVKNHSLLVKLVQAEKPEIVGEGGANLPQVLLVLVRVYKTEMVDEATSTAIAQLILQLGQARLEQLAGKLTEKDRKKLMRICRDAQSG